MKKLLISLAVGCLSFFSSASAYGAAATPASTAQPATTNAVSSATNSTRVIRVHRGCRLRRPIKRGGVSIRHRYRTIKKTNP